MTIIIGFEFEFGWLPEIQSNMSIAKKTKKPIYFEKHIYPEVYQEINDYFSNSSQIISEIKEDPTIKFSKKYYDNFYGVEVVTNPVNYDNAKIFLVSFLDWMKENKKIKTNSTCSLHINISFLDEHKSEQIDYLNLINLVPQSEILNEFKRAKNNYCINTFNKKFSIIINGNISKERSYFYWINKKHNYKSLKFLSNKINYGCLIYNKNNPKTISKLSFNSECEYENFIKKSFINRLNISGKNISIVDKRNIINQRYFEFRMIGNKDYELKKEYILLSIDKFIDSIRKSLP